MSLTLIVNVNFNLSFNSKYLKYRRNWLPSHERMWKRECSSSSSMIRRLTTESISIWVLNRIESCYKEMFPIGKRALDDQKQEAISCNTFMHLFSYHYRCLYQSYFICNSIFNKTDKVTCKKSWWNFCATCFQVLWASMACFRNNVSEGRKNSIV